MFMSFTFLRNQVWKNEFFIWSDTVLKSPEKWRPLYIFALELHKTGRLDEAIMYLEKIVSRDPSKWPVLVALGSVLADKGLHNEALAWFQRALKMVEEKDKAVVFNNIGITLFKQKDYQNAEIALKEAISLDDQYYEAYYNLGVIYWYKGDFNRAIECFQ